MFKSLFISVLALSFIGTPTYAQDTLPWHETKTISSSNCSIRKLAHIKSYLDNLPYQEACEKLTADEKVFSKHSNIGFLDNALLRDVSLLYASHFGPLNFRASKFYRKMREGVPHPEDFMITDDLSNREKKYCWVLMAIAKGNLSYENFKLFPRKSYCRLSRFDMFNRKGEFKFNTNCIEDLSNIPVPNPH